MENYNQQGFSWFMGVVESISDPECMGRIKVRAFGFHTEDKKQIPTEALPWAHVMMPITSSSISGIGQSPTGILCGTWVMGFFRDGNECQDPIIMGSLPSKTGPVSIKDEGFKDPNGVYPIGGTVGKTDTPKPAYSAYTTHPSYIFQKDHRVDKVETAAPPKLTTVSIAEPDAYYAEKTWSSLDVDSYVNPNYPNNKVITTPSGHTIEIDDTAGATRISTFHKSGTHTVITDSGDNTTTVVGDGYKVIFGSDNVLVKGDVNITVNGNVRQLVKGNYHLQVEGNYTENIKGSKQIKIGLSEQTEITQDRAVNIGGNLVSLISGKATETIQKDSSHTVAGNRDIDTSGDMSDNCMGNRKMFTLVDLSMVTTGNSTMFIDGAGEIRTGSGLTLKADGALGLTSDGNTTVTSSGNTTMVSTGSITQTVASYSLTTAGTFTVAASGGVSLDGPLPGTITN